MKNKPYLFLPMSMILSLAVTASFSVAAVREKTTQITHWQLPLKAIKISSKFGMVEHVRGYKKHNGIDLVAPLGTPIYAVNSGVVSVADGVTLNKNYGNVVIISHDNGYSSVYSHLNKIDVKKGQKIAAGEKIASVGVTGKVTGAHLHLELIKEGVHVNPEAYLPFK